MHFFINLLVTGSTKVYICENTIFLIIISTQELFNYYSTLLSVDTGNNLGFRVHLSLNKYLGVVLLAFGGCSIFLFGNALRLL